MFSSAADPKALPEAFVGLSLQQSLAAQICAPSVYGYHHKAHKRQDERHVDSRHSEERTLVDYGSLKRRQDTSAEDGHDESGSTELCIVAESGEGDAVDGREHERHTGTDTYEAVESVDVLEHYHSARQHTAGNGENHQQLARVEIAKEEGADEAREAEDAHRHDVVLLRHHFGLLLGHALGHEDARAVLYDECPAHYLHADIEELGDDTLTVMGQTEDVAQGREEVDVVVLVAVLGHLHEEDDKEHGENDKADYQIRTDKHREVILLYRLKLVGGETAARCRVERTELRLDEVHCHVHSKQRTHRVERLGKVEPPRGRLLRTHGENVGIA